MRAVLNEVASRGVARVSLEAVARAAGVSTGTLYTWFPDRAALLACAYEYYNVFACEQIDALFGEYPEGLPFHRFWLTLTQQLLDDALGRAFVALFRERELFLPVEKQNEIVPAALKWWLERNRDELGPAEIDVQARIVWGMLYACMSEQNGRPLRSAALTRTLGEACWAALRSGRPGDMPLELPPAPFPVP